MVRSDTLTDLLPADFVGMVKKIKYRNPYLEIHVTLKELPEFVRDLAFLNEDKLRWFVGYYPSPEHLERCYGDCKCGRIPRDPLSACYILSIGDVYISVARVANLARA